jgi:hypothetical protein
MDDLTPAQRLEEWVAAYIVAKTGREGTPEELRALAAEVPPEMRAKLEVMHAEAAEAAGKSREFVENTHTSSSSAWNQAWLMLAGVLLGVLLQMDTIEEKEEGTTASSNAKMSALAQVGLDRSQRSAALQQKFVMAVLVLGGLVLATQRYRRIAQRPLRPRTAIEYRMGFGLLVNVVVVMRFGAMLYFVHRGVPWWEALATGVGMVVLQPLFTGLCAQDILTGRRSGGSSGGSSSAENKGGKEENDAIDRRAKETAKIWVDLVCVAFAVGGATLSTAAEWQRSAYLTAHPGTLFTGGLFAHARHINYTGEVVLFLGWAMLTRSRFALLIPCFFYATFASLYAPDLDLHLSKKYPGDFERYQAVTPSLIPFLL